MKKWFIVLGIIFIIIALPYFLYFFRLGGSFIGLTRNGFIMSTSSGFNGPTTNHRLCIGYSYIKKANVVIYDGSGDIRYCLGIPI